MKQKSRLHTVNVVRIDGSKVRSIRAFRDTPKGNRKAEKYFRCKITEFERVYGAGFSTEEDFDHYLKNGAYTLHEGYAFYLIHSD